MKLKIFFAVTVAMFCGLMVQAQQPAAKTQQTVVAKQLPLPTGKLSDPVLLEQDNTQVSVFDRTMNYLGKNLRQSFEITLETFLPFQFKYAIMLNESVEKLTNVSLYKAIDEWYGTRYRYGGTSHKGIDCSAFMQVLGQYAFGWMLPRTAREQYASLKRISKEELKEGDLVFFNTTGGVSHVGMYLQNGKFIHSSSSQGVSISDLDDQYWKARFIGARRAPSNQEMNGLIKSDLN
ncbi:MAG: C40 family peptidase [Chitinophagaceae bacterium]|nr:C40 family peptidase [Chitinophagaceae bacterium]MCU0404473.1 C40 family peptidase [Chitinophagaceae bacterium]